MSWRRLVVLEILFWMLILVAANSSWSGGQIVQIYVRENDPCADWMPV